MEAKCESCGGEADCEHTCPFKEEIGGDYETTCNCCSECTTQCVQDI